MSLLLARLDSKASLVPSGDQAGERSENGRSVRRVISEPSACMTSIDNLPSWLDEKAMREPSGDQAGAKYTVSPCVNCVGAPPSASMEWISRLPSRSE